MIIEFENYFTKTDNFGYFSLFLRKITACTVLLDPVCLFKIAISSPCMLISSCTTIRYCRVISFEWVTPSDPAGRHVVFFLFANKTNRQIDMSRGDYLTKPHFHEFSEFFRSRSMNINKNSSKEPVWSTIDFSEYIRSE